MKVRLQARLRAREDDLLQPVAPDPIAAVLARLDARLSRGPLKGPVKARLRVAPRRRVA